MQETRNNCFWSKKCSTTLRQAKTSKHERRNVTATYISALVLTCFRLTKGHAMFFRPERIVASFLHLMVLLFKVLLNHSLKRQFLLFHCRMSCCFAILFQNDSQLNSKEIFFHKIYLKFLTIY